MRTVLVGGLAVLIGVLVLRADLSPEVGPICSRSSTEVTDAGLQQLDSLEALRELVLQETVVTEAGLMKLAPLSGLRTLYLSKSKVTARGITELQKALPTCNITQV